jgi:hypothetical protein
MYRITIIGTFVQRLACIASSFVRFGRSQPLTTTLRALSENEVRSYHMLAINREMLPTYGSLFLTVRV